jgi:hypothetical protein
MSRTLGAPRLSADSRDGWRGPIAGLAAFALPLLLYCRTVAPTVYGVDSAELSTGAYLLGIVHPPGSPGYLLLAHLFTWLPFGDVGYRVNLLSAIAAAAGSCLLYRILDRLTAQRGIALLVSLLTAVTYATWTSAVAAELYAAQGGAMLALILLALRWRATRRRGDFLLFCWLAGFGLGIHLASVLLLPGLAVLIFAAPARSRSPVPLFTGAFAFVVGAAVYLYLPIRALAALPLNPARDYWHVDLASWAGFYWMVSGGGFRHLFFAVPLSGVSAALRHVAHFLWSNFFGVGALIGTVGLIAGLRRQPAIHAALLVMLLGHLAFFLRYGAGDTDSMSAPVLLLWAIWVGVGAAALGQWLDRRLLGTGGTLGVCVALASLTATLFVVNRPWVDLSQDHSARDHGEALLAALEPQAVFVGAWSDLRIVEYLQYVDGRRRDVQLVDAFFAGTEERRDRIAAALAAGAPVYVSTCRDLPDARLICDRVDACDCYRLRAPAP